MDNEECWWGQEGHVQGFCARLQNPPAAAHQREHVAPREASSPPLIAHQRQTRPSADDTRFQQGFPLNSPASVPTCGVLTHLRQKIKPGITEDDQARWIPKSWPQNTLIAFIVHYQAVRHDMLTNPIKLIHMKTTYGPITACAASTVNLCRV